MNNNINNTRKIFEILWNQVKDWFELFSRKEKYSEYIEKKDEIEIINSLITEINELKEELLNPQSNNLKIQSELSDSIYMLWQLMIKLQMKWKLDWFSNAAKIHKDKILERSPNLKKCELISLETEKKVWRIIKSQNK